MKTPWQLTAERALPLPRAQSRLADVAARLPLQSIALAAGLMFIAGAYLLVIIHHFDVHPNGRDDGRAIMFTAQILRDFGSWVAVLPLLQYATYGSLVSLFGWDAPLVLAPLLTSLALALLSGFIAYRITGGQWWAFLTATLAVTLLPEFFAQARILTFHPPAILFGYAGVFFAVRYLQDGGRWRLAAAGLALPAAVYSYSPGLIFLAIPPLFLLIDRERETLMRGLSLCAAVAALLAPWFVAHVAAFGLFDFYKQRESWAMANGYLEYRNVHFWGIGSQSRADFIGELPSMFEYAGGSFLIPGLVLGAVGLVRLPSWSWRLATLIALAIPVAALIYATPAAYPRYTYVMRPALVLLAVYGVAGVLKWVSLRPYLAPLSHVVAVSLVVLLSVQFVQAVDRNIDTVDRLKAQTLSGKEQELHDMSLLVDDGRAVIGSRISPLARYERDSELLTPDFISREDFITYLSWPSDAEVAEMFRREGVGWLLLQHPADVWERDYHLWLEQVTGERPRHPQMIPDSYIVEPVYRGNVYSLHRVNQAAVAGP